MMYLRTTRAVIIDDEEAEAIPVVRALGRLGMGCAYFSGTLEELPSEPLGGIRLAFLDMQLGSHGAAREIGAQTARVFSKIVDISATPILIVLWTKHDEYIAAFKQALFENEPQYRSALLITRMTKPESAQNIDGEVIYRDIIEIVNKQFPLDFMWLWEQLAHNAATEVTAAIAQLVSRRTECPNEQINDLEHTGRWLNELGQVLRYLVRAAAGSNIEPNRADHDVLEVLAAMHQDRLEHEFVATSSAELDRLFRLRDRAPTSSDVAAINRMLLAAPARAADTSVRPGSVFVPRPELAEKCVFAQCRVDVPTVIGEVLRLTKDREYESLQKRIRQAEAKGRQTDDLQLALARRLADLAEKCITALLEITPACDYAQRKRKVSKFLGGLLVPEQLRDMILKKDSLVQVGSITLPSREGIWIPAFSSQLTYSLPNPESAIKSGPLFRLRSGVLVDILNWYGARSSRPGHMSLRAR
jgi:hypothetical protein